MAIKKIATKTSAPKKENSTKKVLPETKKGGGATQQSGSSSVVKKIIQIESDLPSAPVKATPRVVKVSDKKLTFFDTFGLTKERDQFIENLSMLVISGMPIM